MKYELNSQVLNYPWLYAIGTVKTSEQARDGHGTCMISVIMGASVDVCPKSPSFGTDKKKIILQLKKSILDALNRITHHHYQGVADSGAQDSRVIQ